ncbi:MAG: helix-turn-helix transcriptional regulator [Clostridiaceae bacterium]|jgi:transcriptional regulator with XRE-family HTH domain|nr:helix-turn-helix transcriptional regulator [Clostridiaceae bacterium]
MTFDEILKTIRKELNITQEQLARELNVSFSTLNRWENNRNTPSKLARMRLVEYCTKKSISSDIISELERVQDTIKGTGVINYDDNNQ